MDFEEFREKLIEDLAQDLYENTGAEYTVEPTSINKLQNAGYEGIVIRPEDAAVGINIDAQSLFKDYENGKSYEEVFDSAWRTFLFEYAMRLYFFGNGSTVSSDTSSYSFKT